MPTTDPKRVQSYLELIAGKAGLEGLLETAAPRSGNGFEGIEAPQARAASAGLKSVLSRREPSAEEAAGLEALIIPKLRPAIDIVDGKFNSQHRLWTHLSSNDAIRNRIEEAIPSIGRIELPGHHSYPYGGTGFAVGPNLVMTNRHVAAIFAKGIGTRSLAFKLDHKAGIDFVRERGHDNGRTLTVRRVVMIHPYWDMAILEVENLPSGHKPLTLSVLDISELDRHEIAVIGYPAFDPRNDAAEQDELFDQTYGVKRLQPGQLHRRGDTASFGKMVSAAVHDCSTLGGNSGSAVLDLGTGDVVALHFGGRYQDKNFAVPTFELARDGRVIDTGIQFANGATGGSPPWSDWWTKADMMEEAADEPAPAGPAAQHPAALQPASGASVIKVQTTTADEIAIEIPLQITVRLGVPAARTEMVESMAGAGEGLEAMVEPWRDRDYSSRTGYDENFLDVRVAMPEPADPALLARTRSGETVLAYQNFSIMMHAARRLALITASNVSADPRLKKPEPRRKYTRKALTGLGENDQERWFADPRLDEKFQLPDVFFTRDRKAFDKGHIIRRDDVCWGDTYELLRRANGDTYHVTNCSPQTADFNRSANGIENWGDLETHVLASAAKEKLTLFAGPVLDPSDTIFVGAGGGRNKIRAKIPQRFWKVVVANVQDGNGLASFGFVLEQDLSDVAFEFVVSDEFVPHIYPLADIEAMAGVKFPQIVLDADQYDTVRGAELSVRAGTRRRRRKRPG